MTYILFHVKSLMKPATKIKNDLYYKCIHCGDEIFWNTQKSLIFCKCKKISVDGCEYYVRISGNAEDYKVITR